MTELGNNDNPSQLRRKFGDEVAGNSGPTNSLQSEARSLLSSRKSASDSQPAPGQLNFEDPYPATSPTQSEDLFSSTLAKIIERVRKTRQPEATNKDGNDAHDGRVKPKPKPDGDQLKNPTAEEFVKLVNARRRRKGLNELEVDTSMAGTAERNNEIMNDEKHRSGHFANSNRKEIAFYGPQSAAAAFKGFIKSYGHKIRIDDPNVTKIYVAQDGVSYTAQFA